MKRYCYLLIALYYHFKVKFRRRAGCYTPNTLNEAKKTFYYSTQSASSLIYYMRLRRDFGYTPNKSLVYKLIKITTQNTPIQLNRRGLELVVEYSYRNHDVHVLSQLKKWTMSHPHWFDKLLTPSVCFLMASLKQNKITKQSSMFAYWYSQQKPWSLLFSQQIDQAINQQGVCVVGNGGILYQSALAKAIDAHSLVIRFNQFMNAHNYDDIGRQCNVWVTNPSFSGQAPTSMDWIIITGPEVSYSNSHWATILNACDASTKVIFIPISLWKSAIEQLQAPPSAGFLILLWLNNIIDQWKGISIAGFNAQKTNSMANYHIASSKLKASNRHNWLKEAEYIIKWSNGSLRSIA